jgi:O-6-methylguanine DNA methyltransferase
VKDLQQIVFDEIKKIPFGGTSSYKDIAEVTGARGKERLIGKILSQNKYPIAIPCHRVIRKNGEICGYKLGREFKKILLDWEKKITS